MVVEKNLLAVADETVTCGGSSLLAVAVDGVTCGGGSSSRAVAVEVSWLSILIEQRTAKELCLRYTGMRTAAGSFKETYDHEAA